MGDNIYDRTQEIKYKSQGERRIGEFLETFKIPFFYEKPQLITDKQGYVRLWYPDFWLPDPNVFVEYFGFEGSKEYDKGVREKLRIYNEMKLKVVPIYPAMMKDRSWRIALRTEIHKTLVERLQKFEREFGIGKK